VTQARGCYRVAGTAKVSVVVVPFPFSDLSQAKLCPAIVMADAGRCGSPLAIDERLCPGQATEGVVHVMAAAPLGDGLESLGVGRTVAAEPARLTE